MPGADLAYLYSRERSDSHPYHQKKTGMCRYVQVLYPQLDINRSETIFRLCHLPRFAQGLKLLLVELDADLYSLPQTLVAIVIHESRH